MDKKKASSNFGLLFSQNNILNFTLNIILILVTFLVIPILVSFFATHYTKIWFPLLNGYNASNMTSSLFLVSITVLYVVYTYYIFHTTNKNTEQTANAQKIAYLERKLEKFYMPMQSSLKRFDCDKMIKLIEDPDMNIRGHVPRMYYKMNAVWWDFKSDYNKVVPFTYLASNKVQDVLINFTNIFNSNKVFVKQYPQYVVFDNIISGQIESSFTSENNADFIKNKGNISTYYEELSSEIDNDIISLKADLAKLVNP